MSRPSDPLDLGSEREIRLRRPSDGRTTLGSGATGAQPAEGTNGACNLRPSVDTDAPHNCEVCELATELAEERILVAELRSALAQIQNVLGPDTAGCSTNDCDGCLHEMGEALRIAHAALVRGGDAS